MTHDVWKGAATAGPGSTSLRVPPQVRPVDRSPSSAALTDGSGVEAASWADLLPRNPAIDWVQNHSFLPRPLAGPLL
jgi:hypothetical protein